MMVVAFARAVASEVGLGFSPGLKAGKKRALASEVSLFLSQRNVQNRKNNSSNTTPKPRHLDRSNGQFHHPLRSGETPHLGFALALFHTKEKRRGQSRAFHP
jgi:hypothetical protein